jgi:hypothetical protein
MISGVSLADMGHQESIGFSASLDLANHSFLKGKPAHHEVCKLLQGGSSQPATGAERALLSNKVSTCLVISRLG